MRPTFTRGALTCLLDRCRGYLVNATPEEYVRQDTLDWLITELHVPAALIRSEFSQRRRGGTGRVDIIVLSPDAENDDGDAILVVECKRGDTYLDERVRDQATRYAATHGARYVLLANGEERAAYALDREKWRRLATTPTWRQMLRGTGLKWQAEEEYQRFPWSMFSTPAAAVTLLKKHGMIGAHFGEDSPPFLAPLALNLYGLLSIETASPVLPISDGSISVIEDLGMHQRTFGNSAGGNWPFDRYRSFLVRDAAGSHQVVSLAILGGIATKNHPSFGNRRGRTCLIAAVDDGPSSHVSLEMALDDSVREGELRQGRVALRHNGSLSGKRGSVKRDVVLAYVRRTAPHLVHTADVVLGALPANRLIEWADARDVLLRTIRYALIRDALRAEIASIPASR